MKISPAKKSISVKALMLIVVIIGFAGISATYGQSIVGKWKQQSGKTFMTPEAVKNSHGHLQDVMDMTKMDATVEFKSDHTLIQTVTTGATKTNTAGTWTMSGSTVTISVLGNPALIGVISERNNILTYTALASTVDHQQVIKREWTYSRI